VPAQIYLIQSQQIRTLNQLMWAQRMWEEAQGFVDLPDNKGGWCTILKKLFTEFN
jgi:hypothetical protein